MTLLAAASVAALPEIAAAHPQSALEESGEGANRIQGLWWFMLIVSTIVVAVVVLLVVLALLRRRSDKKEGDWLGSEGLILFGGVVIPLFILAGLFKFTLDTLEENATASAEPEMRMEVVGHQWFWEIRYPEAGAVTANEIHIPTDTAVEVELTSDDVLHSFWVPELQRKMDLIPGRTNSLVLDAHEPGTYRGQCAEFCGLQHANMAFSVVAEERDDFEAWLANQAKPAPEPANASETEGRRVFMSEGCASCHTIRGTEARGAVGPDLTHLADRDTLAALTIENDRGDLGGWVLDPQHIKPGARMPGTQLSGPQTQALLDYLQSLD